jgi:hypothetical protein
MGNTVSRNGSAAITNLISRYDVGSYTAVGGVTNYLSLPAPAGDIWTGDGTLEMWVQFTGSIPIIPVPFCAATAPTGARWALYANMNSSGAYAANLISFYVANASAQYYGVAFTWVLNTWYHIAMVKSGTTMFLFVNGALAGSVALTITIPGVTKPLTIGGDSYNTGFTGQIDDLKIIKGYAKYLAAFTPPLAPHTTTVGPYDAFDWPSSVKPPLTVYPSNLTSVGIAHGQFSKSPFMLFNAAQPMVAYRSGSTGQMWPHR